MVNWVYIGAAALGVEYERRTKGISTAVSKLLPAKRIETYGPPEPYGPQAPSSIFPHTERDLDVMARTLWGEARAEGRKGMQAVANVIMNRYRKSGFPNRVADVCLQPSQFSCWNANDPNLPQMKAVTTADSNFRVAMEVATLALSGKLADITGGADHYLNVPLVRQWRGGSLPSWADLNMKTAQVGQHTFLRLA